MPRLDDVEMGNSFSNTREVEMEEQAASNGHMTSEEVNGESDENSGAIGKQEIRANSSSASDVNPTDVMPSVEPDESTSPATADEEMISPAVEVQKSDRNTTSPTTNLSLQPDYEPPAASQSTKLGKEMARLHEVLAEISPEAAQTVLKERWRLFLLEDYDEAHIAFILRASLKHSKQNILDRVLRDDALLKDTILKAAMKNPDFVEKVMGQTSADVIAAHMPESTMDYVIAERFKTVPGKTLIKWLATAERLGYKADDLLDEEDESVSPNMPSRDSSVELLEVVPETYKSTQYTPQYHPPHPPHPNPQYPQQPKQPYQPPAEPYKDLLLLEQERQAGFNQQQAQDVQAAIAKNARASLNKGLGPNADPARQEQARQEQQTYAQAIQPESMLCTLCRRSFPPGEFIGYTYHINKRVCAKVPPSGGYKWSCPSCLSGFTTKQGFDYHLLRKVCVGSGIAPPTPSISSSINPYLPVYSSDSSQPSLRIAPTSSTPPSRPMYNPAPLTQAATQPQRTGNQFASSRPIAQPPRSPIQIPRPSLGTTHRTAGRPKKDVNRLSRQSPSELTPEDRAFVERAIIDADTELEEKIAAIPTEWSAEERTHHITSLKISNTAKKIQIRRVMGLNSRMRERDEQARLAAGISPAASSHVQEFNASSSSSPSGFPPARSFSPMNSNTASRPSGYSGPPQPTTSHRQPPSANSRVFNPTISTKPSGRDKPLTHPHHTDAPPPYGFGILNATTPSNGLPNIYRASNHVNLSHGSNKRKHSFQEPIGASSGSTPQLSMMEVSAEDAASKFAKGYQKKLADREREDRSRDKDTNMTDAPTAGSTSKMAIAIDISSDSEDEDPPYAKRVETEGDVEAARPEIEESSRRSLAPKMARRGGKR